MANKTGSMIISLDFELLWGRLDTQTIESYGKNVLGARVAVERMLFLFEQYEMHATWGIVGYLYYHNMEELGEALPAKQPTYTDAKYDPKNSYDRISQEPKEYYFAPELIERIGKTRGQEIATHTFSHYYCLESGQTGEQFEADLERATQIAEDKSQVRIESIIFPRNQSNPEYLDILKRHGIRSYRGNAAGWCYQAADKKQDRNPVRRACRLLDVYLPICGNQCVDYSEMDEDGIYNMRASSFLRPYSKKLQFLEGLRVHRIKRQMTYAAKHGKVFHIWWHPHNFGGRIEENMKILEKIALHYQMLHQKYGFECRTMKEVREYCDENRYFGEER